jgi:Ca-activated chloride channel family protein
MIDTQWRRVQRGVSARAFPLLLLLGFAGNAGPEARVLSDAQASEPHLISVNVNLVVLNATVRDRKGRPASDLGEQDFEVYEDGVRQPLRLFLHEDIPVTVGLVIDHSGSMRPKLADVIAAAQTFIEASSPQDEMFVVNFNETVSLGLPDAIRFTNRPDELARAISNAPVTGQTALYDAVLLAQVRLQTGSRDKKVLIVISDGGDNRSKHGLEEVVKMAGQSSALIYTIGIFDDGDADRNPAVLRRLAGATGGEAFFPGELNEVVPICERIARDIRNQYTLGYVPGNTAQPGAFRAIRVIARTAGKSKLVVRTRSGYFAGSESRPDRNEHAR